MQNISSISNSVHVADVFLECQVGLTDSPDSLLASLEEADSEASQLIKKVCKRMLRG